MKEYEYKSETYDYTERPDREVEFRGEPAYDHKRELKYLNAMGQHGWELCHISTAESIHGKKTWYFKRELVYEEPQKGE